MSPSDTMFDELIDDLRDTPTLTAYVDTSTYRHAGRRGWFAMVETLAERVRATLPADAPRREREVLERNLRRLELRVRGLRHRNSTPAWAVFVANGNVQCCAALPCHVHTDASWQKGPWLAPYQRLTSSSRRLPIVAAPLSATDTSDRTVPYPLHAEASAL